MSSGSTGAAHKGMTIVDPPAILVGSTVDGHRTAESCAVDSSSLTTVDRSVGPDPSVTSDRACPVREKSTKADSRSGRRITLRLQTEHEALQQARIEQQTPEWQRSYQHRAGVEGTIAQGISAFGLRRTRYRGLDKTRLQHLLTAAAAAMNLTRLNAWLTDTPFAPTRTSHFAALRPAA